MAISHANQLLIRNTLHRRGITMERLHDKGDLVAIATLNNLIITMHKTHNESRSDIARYFSIERDYVDKVIAHRDKDEMHIITQDYQRFV